MSSASVSSLNMAAFVAALVGVGAGVAVGGAGVGVPILGKLVAVGALGIIAAALVGVGSVICGSLWLEITLQALKKSKVGRRAIINMRFICFTPFNE